MSDFRAFPWIIEVFDLPAYNFYKVIEVLIKVEEGLSRDVVKHLNHVSFKWQLYHACDKRFILLKWSRHVTLSRHL